MQRFRTPEHGKPGVRSHRIGFITYPAFSAMTFAATSVFEFFKIGIEEHSAAALDYLQIVRREQDQIDADIFGPG